MKSQICVVCVMDTSDDAIVFDADGVCNHCKYAKLANLVVDTNVRQNKFYSMVNKIKQQNSGRKLDGIIGLSGGVDSSYLLLKIVEAGLRPLVVHVDGGWNSDEAVSNIYSLVEHLELPLETVVINWTEMRDLQIAFLKSGLANQDTPQDHAFFASLYRIAAKHKIKTVFTGSNVATESILPKSWEYDAMDGRHVLDVAKKYGARLTTFPTLTLPRFYSEHLILRQMQILRPLNYIHYSRRLAVDELRDAVGWRDYGGKHRESRFTDWYQHSYLRRRLGIDKRRAHLSSLIASNQMTRPEALRILGQQELSELDESQMSRFIARKLGVEQSTFNGWACLPLRPYTDFRNDKDLIAKLALVGSSLGLQRLIHI